MDHVAKSLIKHIWFDLEGTLTIHTQEFHKVHDNLRYQTYAKAVNKSVNEKVIQEFEILYKQYGSNSAVFRSLGFPSDYWQKHFIKLDKGGFYKPDPKVYRTIEKLKDIVPISIFTNSKPERILSTLLTININPAWFTYILSGDDIKERKPELDGFYAILEKSNLAPKEILYVGDRVSVDINPAKIVGIRTCLVWGKSKEADYSFEDFTNIVDIFK